MSKHFRDHPQIKSYYGRRETRTRLEPSAAIRESTSDTIEEPAPSGGGRRLIPDGETMKDRETFEDADAARWRDEH